jgi:hypothetical protein
MIINRVSSIALVLTMSLLVLLGPTAAQEPTPNVRTQAQTGSAFTYQGYLLNDGTPVDGHCDVVFALYDDPIGGTLVAGPLEKADVTMTAGRFTVLLDMGDVFDGTALWLDIAVQCNGGGDYTPLTPRQALTATPYAVTSQHVPWSGITDMPDGFADGVDDDTLGALVCAAGGIAKWDGSAWACAADDDTTYEAGPGLILTGTVFAADPAILQLRVTGSCPAGYAIRQIEQDGSVVCEPDEDTTYTAGTGLELTGTEFSLLDGYRLPQGCNGDAVAKWDGSAWACRVDEDSTHFWSLTGNAGTNPATDFVGTTDGQPLSIGASGIEAIHIDTAGQVGIGTAAPHSSAQLEVASTSGGFLLPRMTTDEIASIASPADGLQVYNMDEGKLYIFVAPAVQWKEVAFGPGVIYPSGPWKYVRPITINNTANEETLTDYQVLVQFDSQTPIAGGKMNADGSDLRFTTDFEGWLDYWIENGIGGEFGMDRPGTKVWVKVPLIPGAATTTLYMLYGNPAADAMSDIEATFVLGDDFDDNDLDSSRWEVILVEQGEIQEQNQRLEHLSPKSTPQSSSRLESVAYFTEPVVLEMRFKKGGYVYRYVGFGDEAGDNKAEMYVKDCCEVYFQVRVDGVWEQRIVEPGFWSRTYNPEYYVQIIRRPDGSFIINGSVPDFEPGGPKNWSETFAQTIPLDTPLKVYASESVWSGAWWLWDRYEDDMRVRKYTEPEPVVNLAPEMLYIDFREGQ